MKPTPKQPTTDSPPGPSKTPTPPAWKTPPASKTPPESVPVAKPRTLLGQLPSLETLAGLAATMATPAEKPAATARRAVELLAACERELGEMAKLMQKRDEEVKKSVQEMEHEQAFLSNFVEGENIWYDLFEPGQRLPINKFLAACMPHSKDARRMAKWHAFIAMKLARNHGSDKLPQLNESESAMAAPFVAKRLAEKGIPADSLAKVRDEIMAFLKEDERAIKDAQKNKGTRMRRLYAVVRKSLDKKKTLTPEDKYQLKSISDDEMALVIAKFAPKQIRTLKALVEDLNRPKSAQPKRRLVVQPEKKSTASKKN